MDERRWEFGAFLGMTILSGVIISTIYRRKYKRSTDNGVESSTLINVELLKEGTTINLEETDAFTNQVAGHTNEKMLTYRGLVLKPIIKPLYFFRELTLYNKLNASGTHWTQSLKPFTAEFSGLYIVKRATATTTSMKRNHRTNNSEKGGELESFLENHIVFLGLEDVSRNFVKPCIMDIKMGTQTYEPNANDAKKRKEIIKCPYQAETGFRLVGLKAYDVRCDKHGSLSKHFGRRIEPSMAFAALALCFFDGVRIRRDVVTVAIQKLERIYLWFKSQNSVHFYCSSILITYDGYLSREYSKEHFRGESGTHFLKNLPSHFPPTHEKLDMGEDDGDGGSGGAGVAKNDINDFVEDLNLKKISKKHNRGGDGDGDGDGGGLSDTDAADRLLGQWGGPGGGSPGHGEIDIVDLHDRVHVKMIDFAHALENTGLGLDMGYLKGIQNLISKLHQILLMDDLDIRQLASPDRK